jgi:processive 1,2-diacylglycerol beta-glucosyltransferase
VGHTAAAGAVERALRAIDPRIATETVDSYRYAASAFSTIVADGYIGMIKTVPDVYRFMYDRAERATKIPRMRRWLNTKTAGNLRALIAQRRPDVVVCTHAFPCGVMAEYKRTIDPSIRVVGVVTDFVVHPFWIYGDVDAYAVATAEMRDTLVARGIEPDRIVVSGIPIDARFSQPRMSSSGLRRALGLPLERPLVMLMAGGLGLGRLDSMLRALRAIRTPISAIAIAGRNAALRRRLVAAAPRIDYPMLAFGFVDNVFDFMHASDVLLTKPGGLTASEALAAELPMVISAPLPGQEERNAKYLVDRRAVISASSTSDAVAAVARLVSSPHERTKLRRRAESVRRPHAAAAVAQRVLSLIGS